MFHNEKNCVYREKMSSNSENLIALNFDKKYLFLIKQKQKNSKRPKRI